MATAQEIKNAKANKAYVETAKKYAHLIEVETMRILSAQSKRNEEFFKFRDLTNAINYQLRLPEKEITVDVEAFLRERFKLKPYSEVVEFSANGVRIKPKLVAVNPTVQAVPIQPEFVELKVEETAPNIRDFSQDEIRSAVDGKRFYAILVESAGKVQFIGTNTDILSGTPKLFGRKGNAETAKKKYAGTDRFKGANFDIIEVIALD